MRDKDDLYLSPHARLRFAQRPSTGGKIAALMPLAVLIAVMVFLAFSVFGGS